MSYQNVCPGPGLAPCVSGPKKRSGVACRYVTEFMPPPPRQLFMPHTADPRLVCYTSCRRPFFTIPHAADPDLVQIITSLQDSKLRYLKCCKWLPQLIMLCFIVSWITDGQTQQVSECLVFTAVHCTAHSRLNLKPGFRGFIQNLMQMALTAPMSCLICHCPTDHGCVVRGSKSLSQ